MRPNPLIPHARWERCVTMLTVLVLLVGAGLVVTLLLRPAPADVAASPSATDAPPAPTPASGPLTDWTILVDPGHGGYDGGARARDSGTWEKHITLAVALEVEKALLRQGATVLMTRRTDIDLTTENRPAGLTKKRQDMQARVDMAVEGKADMVLSIHMNEYRSRAESGPQVFYRQGSDSGRLLAGCMQQALISCLQPKKERVAMAGDYFILQLDCPSVLVECGFISNAAEEKLLLSPDYQAKLGEAIALGAVEYASLTAGETAKQADK